MRNSLPKLSYEILKIANQETPRSIFLKKISRLLIGWFNCQEIRLLLKIHKNDSQYELVHCTNTDFEYKITHLEDLPKLLKKEGVTSLWKSILDDNFNASSTFFSEKGSFWSINLGNISAQYQLELGTITDNQPSNTNRNYSLLISPFLYSNERVGLIQLKDVEPKIFSSLGPIIFEEFAQTLSVILINQYTQALLSERVKELSFLYKMSNITRQEDISLDELCRQIIELIPPAWQYPDITRAKITLNDRAYTNNLTGQFEHKMESNIVVNKKMKGKIEIFYTENCPQLDEGPFFYEERSLLDNIANELATIVNIKNRS